MLNDRKEDSDKSSKSVDLDNLEQATAATELFHLFQWGFYVYPIYSKTGDYHPLVRERVAAKSAAQGFPRTRLQEFTPEGW